MLDVDLRQVIPNTREVFEAFGVLTFADYAPVVHVLLWSTCIAVSLKGIDRRDSVAGAVYVAFMAAAGVILIFAFPRYLNDTGEISTQMLVVALLMTAAGARWSWRAKRVPVKEK